MKKSTKILLGLATLWPFVYMILFFVFIFSAFMFMPQSGSEESGPPMFFVIIVPLHLLTMLWVMGLTVFYMVNIFRNDQVDKDKKVLWAVVIFMANLIAMPIYWYLYIWKDAPAGNLPSPSSLETAGTSAWATDTSASNREQYVPPTQPPNWRE